MKLNLQISGFEDVLFFEWTGQACPINKRSTIGKKRMKAGGLISVIVKTPRYRTFCDDMTMVFQSQKSLYPKIKFPIKNPVILYIKFDRGSHRGRYVDMDACLKPMQDALEHAGIIKNDNQVLAPIFVPMGPKKDQTDHIEIGVLPLQPDWVFASSTE